MREHLVARLVLGLGRARREAGLQRLDDELEPRHDLPDLGGAKVVAVDEDHGHAATLPYSTTTRSLAPRPNVSGMYISSAFGGGTMKLPRVVARAT